MLDTLSNSYMIASRMDGFNHADTAVEQVTKTPKPAARLSILAQVRRLFTQWCIAAKTRHELSTLSSQLRQDAGLTQVDVDRELARPFWTY